MERAELKLLRNRFSKWTKTKKAKLLKELLLKKQNGECAICKRHIKIWRYDEPFTGNVRDYVEWDHIKPMFLYGTHEESNLQLLCCSCNARKGINYEN